MYPSVFKYFKTLFLFQKKQSFLPFILSFLILSLLGCKNIKGELEVQEPFYLKSKKGQQIRFLEGLYQAELKLKKKYVSLILRVEGRKTQKAKFNLPQDFNWPKKDGRFQILSEESGQPIDLFGRVQTDREWLRSYEGYENCQYWKEGYRCYPRGGRRGPCRRERRIVRGRQRVKYEEFQNRRQTVVNIQRPSRSEPIFDAQFRATQNWVEKVYSYKGLCF